MLVTVQNTATPDDMLRMFKERIEHNKQNARLGNTQREYDAICEYANGLLDFLSNIKVTD